MEFTKEQLEGFRKDPLMNFFANLLGTSMEEIVNEAEKEKSHIKKEMPEAPTESEIDEDEKLQKKIDAFFDKMVKDGKATRKVENGHPHYSIKTDDGWNNSTTAPEELVEEPTEEVSFSMSKDELAKFITDYTKLENTFRKLEHTFGIDLNANADSIYTQYNAIVWNLIEKIFGEDNRDDIADYVFGDSNFDTIDDLYEELV